MHFLGFLVLTLCQQLSRALPAPRETDVVEIQQWGVVGHRRVDHQVLLNGIQLASTSPEVAGIIRAMSADALLPALIGVNGSSPLRNHTILHSTECVLEGTQLHVTDRLFCDGDVYLTQGSSGGGVWAAADEPRARALRESWEREVQRTGATRARLREGCVKLLTELKRQGAQLRSVSPSDSLPQPQFLVPILGLFILCGLITFSVLLFKSNTWRHPGGVIGSIIHYSDDLREMQPEKKGSSYRIL